MPHTYGLRFAATRGEREDGQEDRGTLHRRTDLSGTGGRGAPAFRFARRDGYRGAGCGEHDLFFAGLVETAADIQAEDRRKRCSAPCSAREHRRDAGGRGRRAEGPSAEERTYEGLTSWRDRRAARAGARSLYLCARHQAYRRDHGAVLARTFSGRRIHPRRHGDGGRRDPHIFPICRWHRRDGHGALRGFFEKTQRCC